MSAAGVCYRLGLRSWVGIRHSIPLIDVPGTAPSPIACHLFSRLTRLRLTAGSHFPYACRRNPKGIQIVGQAVTAAYRTRNFQQHFDLALPASLLVIHRRFLVSP